MQLELLQTPYTDGVSAELVAEIQREMAERYGGSDSTTVRPGEFDPPGGAFLVALLGGEVIGCVGLRRHRDAEVELKRMYVRAAQRRRGYARQLLAAAENRARAMGYRRLLLETGTAQPEAIALYEQSGYERVYGFGHYADSPRSRAYAKALA